MAAPTLVFRCSGLESIRKCGAFAPLSRNKNLESSNGYTRTGTLGHLWMETWINQGADAANAQWQDFVKEVEQEGELAYPAEETLIEAQDFAEWYEDRDHIVRQGSDGISTEQRMQYKYADLNAKITGSADVIKVTKDSVYVLDWKFYSDTSYLTAPEDNLQLKAYAVLAAFKYGRKKAVVQIGLVRQKELWTAEFNEFKMESIRTELYELIKEAVKNYMSFNFGPHCSGCWSKTVCPEYKRRSTYISDGLAIWDDTVPQNNDEALALALAIGPAKTRFDSAKAALKEYVMVHGPIVDPGSGKHYCRYEIGRQRISDKGHVLNALKPFAGKRLVEAVSITPQAVNKLLTECGVSEQQRRELVAGFKSRGAYRTYKTKAHGWRKAK